LLTKLECAQRTVTGFLHTLGKSLGFQRQQLRCLLLGDRPDDGDRVPLLATQRQKSQDAPVCLEPLAGCLAMRHRAVQARGNGLLGVGGGGEFHAEFIACAAGAALAHRRERGWDGAGNELHLRLVAHGFGQTGLQRRHIDDPGQRVHALRCRIEVHAAILVALNLHARHGGGVAGVGPGAQRLQQPARGGVEGVGAHVFVRLGR